MVFLFLLLDGNLYKHWGSRALRAQAALLTLPALAFGAGPAHSEIPPRLDIYHFDVNIGLVSGSGIRSPGATSMQRSKARGFLRRERAPPFA